jgi:AraC-like DNA-binding protein/mannose-6-phosphate isomerase-like protein (cupin superfamily)
MSILISASERITPHGGNIHVVTRAQNEKPQHYHDFYELVIINGGSCTHWLDGNTYRISCGDVFLIPPDMTHAYLEPKNLQLTNIMYTVDALKRYQRELEEIPGFVAMFRTEPSLRISTDFKARMVLTPEQLAFLDAILARWEEEIRRPQAAHQLLSEVLLLDVIIYLARNFGAHHSSGESRKLLQFTQMTQFINEHFAAAIGRDDIMAAAGVSASSGTALFRSLARLTPMQFLLNVRLNHACELLRTTDKSVTAIAFECGFWDSNYFSLRFHQQIGMTPRGYRAVNPTTK